MMPGRNAKTRRHFGHGRHELGVDLAREYLRDFTGMPGKLALHLRYCHADVLVRGSRGERTLGPGDLDLRYVDPLVEPLLEVDQSAALPHLPIAVEHADLCGAGPDLPDRAPPPIGLTWQELDDGRETPALHRDLAVAEPTERVFARAVRPKHGREVHLLAELDGAFCLGGLGVAEPDEHQLPLEAARHRHAVLAHQTDGGADLLDVRGVQRRGRASLEIEAEHVGLGHGTLGRAGSYDAAMANLQDHFKHWDERVGLLTVGHLPMYAAQHSALRSLPTMDRAIELLDRVLDALGERAWIDPEGGETRRQVFVHDTAHPEWLVPVALIEHSWIAGLGEMSMGTFINEGAVRPADAPDDWKPGDPSWFEHDREPDIIPQGPLMRGGSVKLAEGPASVDIRYDDRGVRATSHWSSGGDNFTYARYFNVRPYVVDTLARPPTPLPFPIVCRADLDEGGHTVERFAEMILELDPARAVPHRVLLPLPTPGGVEGAWFRAQWALREAAWEGRIPEQAAWVVIDACEGKALAVGPDFDTAVTNWREEVLRVKPRPPKPEKREERQQEVPEHEPQVLQNEEKKTMAVSTGTIRLEVPSLADIAWPIPVPHHVPAVAVPLPPLPSIPEAFAQAGFTRVLRMFGEHGSVSHALVREEPGGFTLVGEGLLNVVDPATLDAEVDAAMQQQRDYYADMPEGFPNPYKENYPCSTDVFSCWDDGHRKRTPLTHNGGSWGGGWTARNLHGDAYKWAVVRVRLPSTP